MAYEYFIRNRTNFKCYAPFLAYLHENRVFGHGETEGELENREAVVVVCITRDRSSWSPAALRQKGFHPLRCHRPKFPRRERGMECLFRAPFACL